jgi:lysophospholipase L1-like esterase
MRRLVAVLAASLLTLALTGPALAAPGSSGHHAVMYYLSLGDSLAAGQQPIGDPNNNHVTSDGYADQLYTMARAHYPTLRHVKLGCPGETTASFISGVDSKCDYRHGSQLDEAVSFLHAHRQFVAFVTIDLGWNDFTCQNDLACIPAGLQTINANLPGILGTLRAAAGPKVPIVGATLYDPFLALWFSDPVLAWTSVTDAIVPINAFVTGIYAAARMPVADVQGAFYTTVPFTVTVPFPGVGTAPLSVATICAYTWICAQPPLGPDNHANHDGYHAMALAFAAQLGL